jgi:iron complex transport system ATP-binding protein
MREGVPNFAGRNEPWGAVLTVQGTLRVALGGSEASGAELEVPPLSLRAGRVLAVLGPNGSGKTTLLRTLAGLAKPSEGSVLLSGQAQPARSVHTAHPRERASRLAFISQRGEASEAFSAREIVELGLHALGLHAEAASTRVRTALARVDAAHLGEQAFATLSGGERQRVSLARALVQVGCEATADASKQITGAQGLGKVLLADEPTSAMDVKHALLALGVLGEAARTQGLAVAIAMHDIALALRTCDDVVLLARDEQGPGNAKARAAFVGDSHALPQSVLQDVLCASVCTTRVEDGPRAGERVRAGFVH